jgi:adenine specific DNA methylase Mod
MPDDVWSQYSRVCGTFRERTGWHPCQMPQSLLKRIIAVSSNPGDCVLDPFTGSGTTPAAAYQLGRNYVGIEISQKYVENAEKRLCQLKKKPPGVKTSLFFSATELNELERLLSDVETPAKEIVADKELLELFTNQFSVRMNNTKQFGPEQILTALRDLAD